MASSPNPYTIGGVRVSTDMQADRYGPARQREDILREAERQGLSVSEWVEESITGTDHDRAAVNRYYDLARQRPGLNVIFSHPNRVGRHVEVTVGIARQLHGLGATVWIAGVGSLREARNWKYFLRDAADAEIDHGEIVERLQRGKYSKAAQNRWPHGQPPYGYRIVRDERGKSITIEPNEHAPTVRRIFDMALEGLPLLTITQALIDAGVAPARPHKSSRGLFNLKQVRYILTNPLYTGRREFRGPEGQVAVVTYPPLVSAAEFAQAQAHVESRRRNQPRRTRHPALFAGHLRCSECGGGMSVFSNGNTSKKTGKRTEYVYYRCRGNANRNSVHFLRSGGQPCTIAKMHPMADIDEAGWQLFCAALTSPEFLAAAVQREQPKGPDHTARIAEIKAQMAQAVQRAVAHALPDDVLSAALEPLRAELAALVGEMRTQPTMTADMSEMAEAMQAYLPTLTTLEQRREALDVWQARLVVSESGPERVDVTVFQD